MLDYVDPELDLGLDPQAIVADPADDSHGPELADTIADTADIVLADIEADAVLSIGQYDTGSYGNRFEGTNDTSGDVTFVFTSIGEDLTLTVTGYDIDTRAEILVSVNGEAMGFLEPTAETGLGDTTLVLSSELMVEGENTLTFEHTIRPGATWGITDILLQSDGIMVSSMPIDPEFTPDGLVTWQTDDKFYLGQMDMDTGAVKEIINEVDITPVSIKLTHQGPEIVETTEYGVGAIGVTNYGLVYYTATETILLEETGGYKIGYMPKGEMDGLRFVMHDYYRNLYLYDDGEITLIDLNGGIVTAWIDSSNFIVSFLGTDVELTTVYNLDTGVMTPLAGSAYGSPAHQGAYTDSEGVQWAALTGGEYHDIWRNTGEDWEFVRRIESPYDIGPYLYSPEFFEWQGQLFLSGNIALGSGASVAAPVLYNIDTDAWSLIGPEVPMIDPEVLVLNNDRLAYYYSDIEDPANFIEYYFIVTYEEVLAAQFQTKPDVSDPDPVIDAELIIGQYETGTYGNRFDGALNENGVVSFAFEATAEDLTLHVAGYDIDTDEEVAVLVNDAFLGYLNVTEEDSLGDSVLDISADLLVEGQNTLSFVQTITTRARWGMTDVLLMGSGIHVSDLPIDPEFSADGYVAWQTNDYFYLGQMDLDTGAMREVLHEVDIKPVDIRLTQQGPEVIETSLHGIGAIGVTRNGLVHYTETEAYLLPGTAGLEIGYTPKGITPGLRFTAHDDDNNVFLYDNGTLTPLDFNGGIVTSWLNESEFVVSYRAVGIDLLGVYNVDTEHFTPIAGYEYGSPAHQAAFTTSEGVQWMALTGGEYHDLWRKEDGEWAFFRRIESPLSTGTYFYSPEFFEWEGHVFVAGVVAQGPGEGVSAPAVYDIDSDAWAQIGEATTIIDPEVFVMNDGKLAYYYSDISDPANFVEYFFTTTHDAVTAALVVDGTGAAQERAAPDHAMAVFSAGPVGARHDAVAPVAMTQAVSFGQIPSAPLAAPLPAMGEAFAPFETERDARETDDFVFTAAVQETEVSPPHEDGFGIAPENASGHVAADVASDGDNDGSAVADTSAWALWSMSEILQADILQAGVLPALATRGRGTAPLG